MLRCSKLDEAEVVSQFEDMGSVFQWVKSVESVLGWQKEAGVEVARRSKTFNYLKGYFNKHLKSTPSFWGLGEFEQFLLSKVNQSKPKELNEKTPSCLRSQIITFFQNYPSFLPMGFDFKLLLMKFALSASLQDKPTLHRIIDSYLQSSQRQAQLLPSFKVGFSYLKYEYFSTDRFQVVKCFNELVTRMDEETFSVLVREAIRDCRFSKDQLFTCMCSVTKQGPNSRVVFLVSEILRACLAAGQIKTPLKYTQDVLPRLFGLIENKRYCYNVLELLMRFAVGAPCSDLVIRKLSELILGLSVKSLSEESLNVLLRMAQLLIQKYRDTADVLSLKAWFDRKSGELIYSLTPIADLRAQVHTLEWSVGEKRQFTVASEERKQDQPRGLQNLGNTCYMNSFVQAIYSSRQLRQRIFKVKLAEVIKAEGQQKKRAILDAKFVFDLQKLFVLLYRSKRPFVSPRFFKDSLPQPFARSYGQHDASQFGRIYLDFLERALKNTTDANVLHDYCLGRSQIKIQCTGCHEVLLKQEPFMDLTLPSPQKEEPTSVQSRLTEYFRSQLLEGENCYMCKNCQSLKEVKRSIRIQKLPNYLILTLNRFRYDREVKRRVKLFYPCELPNQLSLKPFVTGDSTATEYVLHAIIVHRGHGAESGHYYALASQDLATWNQFDDSYVNAVSESPQVMLAARKTDNPYMLFYIQTDRLAQAVRPKEEFKLGPGLLNVLKKDEVQFMEQQSRRSRQPPRVDLSKLKWGQMKKEDDEQDERKDREFRPDVF